MMLEARQKSLNNSDACRKALQKLTTLTDDCSSDGCRDFNGIRATLLKRAVMHRSALGARISELGVFCKGSSYSPTLSLNDR